MYLLESLFDVTINILGVLEQKRLQFPPRNLPSAFRGPVLGVIP